MVKPHKSPSHGHNGALRSPSRETGRSLRKPVPGRLALASFRSNVPQEATADVWHQQAGEPHL